MTMTRIWADRRTAHGGEDPTTKFCPGCGCDVPLSGYFRNRRQRFGVQTYCKPCMTARVKEYNRRHPEWYRAKERRTKYRRLAKDHGTTVAVLDALLARQGNKCAICKRPETHYRTGRIRKLSLDHDHDSGHARGFLCAICNTGLSHFGDDPARLRRAARYLSAVMD